MADDLRKLQQYIINAYVVRDEQRAIELDAPAGNDGQAIEDDKREAARRENERMDAYASAFAEGLIRAHQRATLGGTTLALDDRNPIENAIADALIGLLVSNDLATSRTEATSPNHYIYLLSIRWDRLRDVASAAGVNLAQALAREASA